MRHAGGVRPLADVDARGGETVGDVHSAIAIDAVSPVERIPPTQT